MTSLLLCAVRRARGPVREDSGFSLIEAVVALSIATVAFTALAASGMVAIRASLVARANQQSADAMTQQLESIRLLDYGSVANVTADLAGDPDISSCSGVKCIDPGTGTKENIYVGSGTGGAVSPHIRVVDHTSSNGATNHTTYTLKTYVTTPADSYTDKYHRVTVVASWSVLGQTHTRRVSTMIAYSQKGLPLPVFSLVPRTATTVSVNSGAEIVYGFKLTNQGAPDRFNLTASNGAWTWYVDDGDGIYDDGLDTALVADTNGDGIRDTGRLNPNGYLMFWAVRTATEVPTAATPTISTSTTWTAKSVGQPTATTSTKTAVTTANVVFGVVAPTASPTPTGSVTPTATPTPTGTATSTPTPTATAADCNTPPSAPDPSAAGGYSLVARTLHNASTVGNTTAQVVLPMDTSAPVASALYEYSSDVVTGQPGRVLATGGTSTSGGVSQVADWRYTVGSFKGLSGTAVATVWVAPLVGNTAPGISLTAYVYSYKTSGGAKTVLATIPLASNPNTCIGFQKLVGSGAVSLANRVLGTSDQIGLRIVNTGSASVRIGYDVTSSYPATLVLPQK